MRLSVNGRRTRFFQSCVAGDPGLLENISRRRLQNCRSPFDFAQGRLSASPDFLALANFRRLSLRKGAWSFYILTRLDYREICGNIRCFLHSQRLALYQGTTLVVPAPFLTERRTRCLVQQPLLHGSVALPFVIPSAVEGSAVPRTFPGNVSTERRGADLQFSRLILELFFDGAKSNGDLQFCGLVLEMFFDRVLQVEVKVCRAYGRSDNVGGSMPQPCRAGLTFGTVGPTGLKAPTASSKNIPTTNL